MEIGCPPGTMRDLWLRFPRDVSDLDCNISKSAFVGVLSFVAFLDFVVVAVALVSAFFVKKSSSRMHLLGTLPYLLASGILCAGSAANTSGSWWSTSDNPAVWILFGLWGGFQYFHILINTNVIRKLAANAIPKSLRSKLDQNERFDIVESGLLAVAAVWMVIQIIAFCIMVPVSQFSVEHYTAAGSQAYKYKDFWFALGCWCHPIATFVFIFIPFRHTSNLLKFFVETTRAVEHNMAGGSGASGSMKSELMNFERKLRANLIQAVVGGLLSQLLWILVSDARIFGGFRWYLAIIILLIGLAFPLTMVAFYAPKRIVPKFIRDKLVEINMRGGPAKNSAAAVSSQGQKQSSSAEKNNTLSSNVAGVAVLSHVTPSTSDL